MNVSSHDENSKLFIELFWSPKIADIARWKATF